MKLTKASKQVRIILDEESVYFGGMNLTYCLSVCEGSEGRCFYISVKKGDEQVGCDVGSDLWRATEQYQSIVHGTVTPCTLEEVLEELQYAS